ncbi:hypothetical protein SASPL_124620 [Salvia splendens]|uniref:Uncharacterized protein n=1 Tax=Salvia splendens TaxID=180675 RepID=A0A8X8XFM0_SALSN|nr:hypothetical protein SASPL_124620 [Salvia splendens]
MPAPQSRGGVRIRPRNGAHAPLRRGFLPIAHFHDPMKLNARVCFQFLIFNPIPRVGEIVLYRGFLERDGQDGGIELQIAEFSPLFSTSFFALVALFLEESLILALNCGVLVSEGRICR